MTQFNPLFSLAGRVVAMAGGFLFLARNGAGELSIDNRRATAVGTPVLRR